MNKVLYQIIILVLVSQSSYSQGKGLVFDDASYNQSKTLPNIYARGFGTKESVKSLKEYCPYPNNQGEAGSCVGQSVGYGAMTILKAIENKWDRENATKQAYSAMYLYNKVKDKGCGGISFESLLDTLFNSGNIKMEHFEAPDQLDNCDLKPISDSIHYKIKNYVSLFKTQATETEKIMAVRHSIASNSPVVIGMMMTEKFNKKHVNKDSIIYKPGELYSRDGHAMIATGYDDIKKQIEILNSWGAEFGDKGFFYMSYKDFASEVKYAYRITIEEKKEIVENKPIIELTGSFDFKYLEGFSPIKFKSLNTKLNNGIYELDDQSWAIGSDFRVEAIDMKKESYLYIFSVDEEKKPYVHWPRNENFNKNKFGLNESPLIPDESAIVIIPDEKTVLTKDTPGTDHLFILYSADELDEQDFKSRIEKTVASENSVTYAFYKSFEDLLIPTDDLNLDPNKMHIEARSTEGSVAPIILKVSGGK